ncbi:hypothetical protein H5410_016013 [Solanum commersonii]|uniref:Zinc finger GRF-type domain-containing protein n=1 Tax=Solanum commersonii TaxID=4109 RepID=A0A9J5ZV34_SOLCO|nr:hypothetical protein H5410_016013 [Solanum commersonii]
MNYNRRLVCLCGTPPILKISWKNDNPGRRFLSCRHYGLGEYCDFGSVEEDQQTRKIVEV